MKDTRLFTKEVEHKGVKGTLCVSFSDRNEYVYGFTVGKHVSPGRLSDTVSGACWSAEKAFVNYVNDLRSEDEALEHLSIHGFTEVKDLI